MPKSRRMRKGGGWFDSIFGSTSKNKYPDYNYVGSNSYNSSTSVGSNNYPSSIGSSLKNSYNNTMDSLRQKNYMPSIMQKNRNSDLQQNPYSLPNYGTRGGRTYKKSKKMRGGYSANISTTRFSDAASFSEPTANPQAMVGGRTKRNRKHRGSRKHR